MNKPNPNSDLAEVFYNILLVIGIIAGLALFYFTLCYLWYGVDYLLHYSQYAYQQTATAAIWTVFLLMIARNATAIRIYLATNYNFKPYLAAEDKSDKK